MKKILLLLAIITVLGSCEQAVSPIDETDEILINYFVDIESNKTAGTENTEFTFKANTNDVIDQWIIDGAIIPAQYTRSAENDLVYSFSSGSHKIEVLTTNGAVDSVEISVIPVETVFKLSATTGTNTTEFYMNYPLLTIEGTEYNIETMGNNDFVTISETEEIRIISLNIIVDHTDSFSFINNNAFNVHGINLDDMSANDLIKMITIFFPERYEPPEPVIPFFSSTVFNLSGHSEATSDSITIHDEYAVIDGANALYSDFAIYDEDVRTVILSVGYDSSDSFLFINGNMNNFFGVDFDSLSYHELIIAADILSRYPEEGLLELVEVY